MAELINWLQEHESLSGWAQFFGAMLALLVTYFTAFAPHWRRRRQLERAAQRLLLNGYETIESYHRTSAHFLPNTLSLRTAGLSMLSVANEIDRFPIYELADQGVRSTARSLVAICGLLKLLNLALDDYASNLNGSEGTPEDQELIRGLVAQQMETVEKILSGAELSRPEWPVSPPTS